MIGILSKTARICCTAPTTLQSGGVVFHSETMAFSNDPTDEIALAVAQERWDDVLASRPASPTRVQPEGGWELDIALSLNFNSTSWSVPKSRRAYKYKSTVPSRLCHICGRKTDKLRVAPCGRVINGLCRKVVCEKCCSKTGLIDEAPVGLSPNRNWTCPHCRGICISTAQCSTYGRTNFRRHIALARRRREKFRM